MKAMLEAVLDGYIDCALWSSYEYDEDGGMGSALDEDFDRWDIADETLASMIEDVSSFIDRNAADLQGMEPAQIGHDFWLTRNHHGAGFWDRGLGERGDRLTKASQDVYGEVDLYVGDDGLIYSL